MGFLAFLVWHIPRCGPLPGAAPGAPLPIELVAGITLYACILTNNALEATASGGTPRAWYLLIEAAMSGVALACYVLRAAGCDRLLHASAPQYTLPHVVSWLLYFPALITLMWLVSMGPRATYVACCVAAEVTALAGVLAAVLQPAQMLRRALLAVRIGGLAFTLACYGSLLMRIVRHMVAAKHAQKALAVLFCIGVQFVVMGTYQWLCLQDQAQPRWRLAMRVAVVAQDAGCRALLTRALLVANAAKADVRQMEVMRAIESSSSYKARRLCARYGALLVIASS